jgi:hypothetical protein
MDVEFMLSDSLEVSRICWRFGSMGNTFSIRPLDLSWLCIRLSKKQLWLSMRCLAWHFKAAEVSHPFKNLISANLCGSCSCNWRRQW